MSDPDARASSRRRALRWAGPEWVLAGTSALALASLFLPWFGAQIVYQQPFTAAGFAAGFGRHALISGQVSGVKAHGYLWVAVTLVLLILTLLAGRPALDGPRWQGSASPRLSLPSPGQLMLATLAALNVVITLLGFLSKPSGVSLAAIRIAVVWRYGAVTALIFAAIAVGVAIVNLCMPRGTYVATPPPNMS